MHNEGRVVGGSSGVCLRCSALVSALGCPREIPLLLSLKEREKIAVLIVWRGRVDNPSKCTKAHEKSRSRLSKTAERETNSLEVRITVADSVRHFPCSPQTVTTTAEKPPPAVWATRANSATARLIGIPRSQQLHQERKGNRVPTRDLQGEALPEQSKSRWRLAQRLCDLKIAES